MKSLATAAKAAIEAGTARVGAAIEILAADEPIRVWTGDGYIEIGDELFGPLGDRTVGITGGATIGGIAQNTTLTLSGIEPELIELLDAASVKNAPVTIWSLIFDTSGTQLLDAFVHRRGRVDRVPVRETSGGTATVSVEVESPGRGLGRRTGRMRSDADQRLIDPNDGGMKHVTFAGEKNLYWGGKRPSRAGAALGGGSQRGEAPNFRPGREFGQR